MEQDLLIILNRIENQLNKLENEIEVRFSRVENQLNKLENEIEVRFSGVENELGIIKKSNENMNEHISFVDNVYETIKNPFYYIINKINPISNGNCNGEITIPVKSKTLTEK